MAVAEPRDVRVIATSAASVRFVVQVPEARTAGPTGAAPIEIAGYEPGGSSGSLILPERTLNVAVPAGGAVRVTGAGSAPEERDAAFAAGGGGGDVVRLASVSWLRNQRVAQVVVRPVVYDARARRLTIFHQVEVEVDVEPAIPGGAAMERQDPFEPLYRAALVNYEQGRAWRRLRPAVAAARAFGASAATPASLTPDTSVYVGRKWVKIAVPGPGFYRVGFDQLRRSRLFNGDTTVALDSLRLFTWPGVPVLPEDSYCDSCGIAEVAMAFVENGNGLFSNNRDYFYFYAQGASGWADEYDASQPDTVFVDHPYESRNFYYLTVATTEQPMPGPPERIAVRSGALGDTTTASVQDTFPARLHLEEDNEYQPDATPISRINVDGSYRRSTLFWEKWFWTTLNRNSGFRTPVEPPGIDPTQSARMRLRVWGLAPNPALPYLPTVKSPGIFDHYLDVRLGPVQFPRRGWNGNGADIPPGTRSAQTFDTTFTGLGSTGGELAVDVANFIDPDPTRAPLRVDRVGVAWCDLFYPRRFEPVGDQLAFDAPQTTGDDIYRIGPFAVGTDSMPRVFDVTEPLRPIEVVGFDYRKIGPGAWQLRFRPVAPGRRRYRTFADWPEGPAIARLSNTDVADVPIAGADNLRSATRRADYLVIYYDGFKAAADTLLAWRAERLPLAGKSPPYDVMAVPISAIYDQFSGGRTDPAAIRNFLRAAFYNWSVKPTFVTLLGDASFDFKNFKGLAPTGLPGTLLPSYEGGFDNVVFRQFATDDWLLNVDAAALVVPDFLGGRIPARDAAGALAYVHKLLAYERSAPLDDWRDRMMLIADDNQQGGKPDDLGWDHLLYTIALDTLAVPPRIDRSYVYLHRYPDGPNGTKPGARADLLDGLNRGVVLANYIGHGSPFKITDESVMIDSDADQLVNATRPSVFIAASCDVGKFNDPTVVSLGERLIANPNGGCVGVISATELAYSFQNSGLNQILVQNLFAPDPSSGQYYETLSQGLLAAKAGGTNSLKYQLMGDAATRAVLPHLFAEVALEDTSGHPVTAATRGQVLQVRGQVLDHPGGAPVALDGSASLLIEDAAPLDSIPDCTCPPYPFRAAPMFRGDWAISGGRFSGRFLVPMDAAAGPRGRVRAYVAGTGEDGAGSLAMAVAPGTAPADDRQGPRITLSFPGGGLSVRPDAVLRVDLSDPSGILITGHTPRNGIVVTLDDDPAQRQEITSSFRYAEDSYQSGTAFYPLGGLAPGPHRVVVSASDNLAVGIGAAQHRSEATLAFEVSQNPVLQITRAFLFPNPIASRGARAGGHFIIDAPGDSVNALVKVFTVSGRLVRTLERFGSLGQVQVPWDGRDDEGQALANGVYLFTVLVNPRAADGSSSGRQRASAEGRIVVVNH